MPVEVGKTRIIRIRCFTTNLVLIETKELTREEAESLRVGLQALFPGKTIRDEIRKNTQEPYFAVTFNVGEDQKRVDAVKAIAQMVVGTPWAGQDPVAKVVNQGRTIYVFFVTPVPSPVDNT